MKTPRVLAALALTAGAAIGASCEPLPAAADLAPAPFWCASRRPHTYDWLASDQWNYWYAMGPGVLTARCVAEHDGPNGRVDHWYHVTIWDQNGDGVVERIEWTPLTEATW